MPDVAMWFKINLDFILVHTQVKEISITAVFGTRNSVGSGVIINVNDCYT